MDLVPSSSGSSSSRSSNDINAHYNTSGQLESSAYHENNWSEDFDVSPVFRCVRDVRPPGPSQLKTLFEACAPELETLASELRPAGSSELLSGSSGACWAGVVQPTKSLRRTKLWSTTSPRALCVPSPSCPVARQQDRGYPVPRSVGLQRCGATR